MANHFHNTSYTLTTTLGRVMYTLFDPANGEPLLQMQYTAEQAEDFGSSLMLAAAAVRMAQADSGNDE